jgi:diguanylate cyclase (GGDEF)-like protein/PAS domain S-box-containing protein
MRSGPKFRPFVSSGRRTIAAILLTFVVLSAVSVTVSIWVTSRSQNQATLVEVAARQRTLAERYVNEVLLARAGAKADPGKTADLLAQSARTLLEGGTAPGVEGDDDEITVSAATEPQVRAQLEQQQRLVADLTATGRAYLAHRPVSGIRQTAHEHVTVSDPVKRLRVLAIVTSNVALNAARSIASSADDKIGNLIEIQIALGVGGLVVFLLLGWGLIAATRRQTAHFRSLVTSSTDLVLVFGRGGCRYASQSVLTMLGCSERDVLGGGFETFVHVDDRPMIHAAYASGEPHEILFRVMNKFKEWRHLEAHVTDLQAERHVRGVVLNARDITERVRLEEELTRQAFHDGLTGLPNRALFRDRLDQALARCTRSREPFSVLLVDLDGFKQVNDSLGHDAGDQLLQQIAVRFAEVTRPSDTLARLGGDEFAVLLEGSNEHEATSIADRLLERLSEPAVIAGRELSLGASVGIVVHEGGAGLSEDLVRHADVAMYAAKEAGRGRYEVFRYEMAREFGELLGLEHDVRLGLQRGEFTVHYQPEVELGSDEVVGVEALLRWHSPTRGEIPPMRFIPVAEATGLILPLGEFALREACIQTAAWRREGLLRESFVTWVNLSGRQLSAGGIGELVHDALEAAGLPASYLGLEVTETAIVKEGVGSDRARAELQELHDQGVRLAIDDFGTGVSSLAQLQRFPVDMIKVDRSFVQGVEHDLKGAAIAANVVSLAHALGLVAVAEGIESDGQLISMKDLDCDLAQGFLFARPAPAAEIGNMLAQGGVLNGATRTAAATAAAAAAAGG